MDIRSVHDKFMECNQELCTDTRNIVDSSLFVALRGETHNGNEFAHEALENGCKYAVVDDSTIAIDDRYILVEDTTQLLQDLARYHRLLFNIPVIAITGSSGKTTTKELIYTVLSSVKNVLATSGNMNNHIGVPMTLLKMNHDTDIAVIEMGANHVGEIQILCDIARPTHGIITNIGDAHLGTFGGPNAIVREKTKLYDFLRVNNGYVFVNNVDHLLVEKSAGIKKRIFYRGLGNDEVKIVSSDPLVSFEYAGEDVATNLTGKYNLINIEAAITIGNFFKVKTDLILQAIREFHPQNNRSEIENTSNNNIIIKDFYNASPDTMIAALMNLHQMNTNNKRKVAILGDMFELGEFAHDEHRKIAKLAEEQGIDQLILVGENFSGHGALRTVNFNSTDEAAQYLGDQDIRDSIILLKASRDMAFEKLFEILR